MRRSRAWPAPRARRCARRDRAPVARHTRAAARRAAATWRAPSCAPPRPRSPTRRAARATTTPSSAGQRRRTSPPRPRRAARPRHDVGDQPRLGDDEQRRRGAERDRHDEEHPRRARVAAAAAGRQPSCPPRSRSPSMTCDCGLLKRALSQSIRILMRCPGPPPDEVEQVHAEVHEERRPARHAAPADLADRLAAPDDRQRALVEVLETARRRPACRRGSRRRRGAPAGSRPSPGRAAAGRRAPARWRRRRSPRSRDGPRSPGRRRPGSGPPRSCVTPVAAASVAGELGRLDTPAPQITVRVVIRC